MTYIEQLQEDRKLLMDFYIAFTDFDMKRERYENTAYKGDALKALNESRGRLDGLSFLIQEMMAKKPAKKEAVNA